MKEPSLSEIKLLILQTKEDIREEMKELYAIKLVEKVMFGMLGFILMAVLGGIVGLVVLR